MHHTDMRAVGGFPGERGRAREVYLIGTSRGTLSVAYLATVMAHPNVKGYVLTATLADRTRRPSGLTPLELRTPS